MKKSHLTLFSLLLSTATPVLAQVSTSPAPASEPDNTGVGDIVVTAQRRSESVQKVPISVATITADRIGPAGARNAVDLTQQVVGLQINKQISGAKSLLHNRLRKRRDDVFWCVSALTGLAKHDLIVALPRHGQSDGAPFS